MLLCTCYYIHALSTFAISVLPLISTGRFHPTGISPLIVHYHRCHLSLRCFIFNVTPPPSLSLTIAFCLVVSGLCAYCFTFALYELSRNGVFSLSIVMLAFVRSWVMTFSIDCFIDRGCYSLGNWSAIDYMHQVFLGGNAAMTLSFVSLFFTFSSSRHTKFRGPDKTAGSENEVILR